VASLKGLAYWAMQNQAMGRPLKVSVGGKVRCMVAEMAPNVLATAAGEGNVPQIRFVCDGYCGVFASRPTKSCRTIDRQAVSTTQVAAPPGLLGVAGTTTIATPYHSGAGGSVAAPAGLLGLGGLLH
jgi:hypothetical protein